MKPNLAVIPNHTDLIQLPAYEEMCRAIATCHRVDEVKQIRDKAEALRAYMRQTENKELEVQFAEIKIRAERQAGELLIEMRQSGELAKQDQGRPQKNKEYHDDILTLREVNLSPLDSSRFQQVAKVPEQEFEDILQDARDKEEPITSAKVRRLNQPAEKKTAINPELNRVAQESLPNGKPLAKGDPNVLEVWGLFQRWEETYFSNPKMTPEYIVMGLPRDFWPTVISGSEKMIAFLTRITEVIYEHSKT